MTFKLGPTSIEKLRGVHPLLIAVVCRAIRLTTVDFTVYEGLRSLERQKELVASGASKTLDSRHLVGCAVDLPAWVNGHPSWENKYMPPIRDAMYSAANELGVTLRYGGDWNGNGIESDESFRDAVHWELTRAMYGDWSVAA